MKENQIKKIIFIICDTLRAQNVGLYGANPSPTPNIDALGKKGVVFTNAYATITKTDPSITAIMTGKYPLSTGLVNHAKAISIEEERNIKKSIFLSEILQKNGYKTTAIDWMGRWHKRGYDYYSGKIIRNRQKQYVITNRPPFFIPFMFLDKILVKLFKKDFFLNFFYPFFENPTNLYDPADAVIKKSIDVLNRNLNNKLFLYLHFWDAHAPYLRSRSLKEHVLNNAEDNYNLQINFIDKQIGRLIEYLEKTGQIKDTLIIFTSDHGENFNEHAGVPFSHQGLYEEVTRIPLIMNCPYLPQGKISILVQHVDILPTIVDLLNIPFPYVDGRSLVPIILKKKDRVRDFAYFQDIPYERINMQKTIKVKVGLKLDNYKFTETFSIKNKNVTNLDGGSPISTKEELYDLTNDRFEKKNVAEKKISICKNFKAKLQNIIQNLNTNRLQNNYDLKIKVEKSIAIIRKALKQFKNNEIVLAWTGGKDSTVLLHLVRAAFNGKIPFKVIFNDSTMEFKEIYEFIKKISKLWDINLITIKHSEEELKEFHETKSREKQKELSRIMKITAINSALKKYKIKAFMAGIRWDEHESRSREKYFSPRSNHMRIHPILHFTEKDIWEYIKHFGVPYVDLYSKGYRSLGEKPFTQKAKSGGDERSGRERDKEQLMSRLRKMGYW